MDPIFIILIGTVVVLFCIILLKLHAAISLLLAALVTGLLTSSDLIYQYAIQKGMSIQEAQSLSTEGIGRRLADAFGNTSGKIGILIALGSIIGACLMRSGGAERIIRGILRLFGKKNTSLALIFGSFTLAIPVFFDTVFYLMLPLVKSIGVKDPKKFSLYLMSVMAGGVMAHSLIPPTPGPLFVAQELGVDIGVMMIGGIVIGLITVTSGYIYAKWANKKWDLSMRDTADITIKDLKQISVTDEADLPSLSLSLLPVVLPIFFITSKTFLDLNFRENTGDLSVVEHKAHAIFSVLGDPNIALIISAVLGLHLMWYKIKNIKKFQKYVTEALTSAGMIILITASGGVFGQMLQQSGIGIRIQDLAGNYQMALLPMAFLITAAVRTAQGSATIAMVTTIGIMSGVVSAGLQFHPVYLALAIGCGSKVFSWMNDSAFWIITEMSGMEEKETVRYFSILMVVMAFSGLISLMILSKFLPFI
ncbi:GntP family permease [Flavobacterium sp. W22_SRS_FP1]|uniref:GntP family permease n=1 Tax=Flavobacterium sp. W22_SRS_FP1 TaxID=3240276 RepID=UPI003F90AF18